MSIEKYNLIMSLLDIIENEFNKLAREVNHINLEDFNKIKKE